MVTESLESILFYVCYLGHSFGHFDSNGNDYDENFNNLFA